MKDECQDAMAQVLGRALKPSEAKNAEDAVSLQMRMLARADRQGWLAMSPQQRLETGAKAAAQAVIDDLKLKQRRIELQIAAHDRIGASYNREIDRQTSLLKPGEKLDVGARSRIVGDMVAFNASGHGITSSETWERSIATEAFGNLMPMLTHIKGFAQLFDSKQGISDLVHEIFGENTGNAAAKEGAAAWAKTTDGLRQRGNDAGMNIGKLEDWRFPQNWSQARIANAGVDKFSTEMLQHLDRSKYLHADGSQMNDAEMTKMLHNVFDTVTTDGANKNAGQFKRQSQSGAPAASYANGDAVSGVLANRMSAHRALFFKDADSYLTAHGNYGDSSLYPTLIGHINGIARDIGLSETWGPNAEQAYRYFADKAHLEDLQAERGAKRKLNHLGAVNDAMFDMAMGRRDVVNQTVADIGQGVRNFETAVKLPKVIFSALGDYAGMAATAFANRVPFSEVFLREMHALNPGAAEDRAVAEHSALGINRVIGHLNRFGTEDFQTGGGSKAAAFRDFTSKLASGVLNATGQEAIWDARRKGLGSVIQSYLGKTVQQVEHFADLNVQDHGILANKGVTEGDWQTWRQAQGEDWGMKHSVLTPKSIYAIPDEAMRAVIAPREQEIRTAAAARVDELQRRNQQETEWVTRRAESLSTWVTDQRTAIDTRVGKAGEKASAQASKLSEKLGMLQTQVDLAKAFWQKAVKPTSIVREAGSADSGRQIGKSNLRNAGVSEGQATEAAKGVRAKLRDVTDAASGLKDTLESGFEQRWKDKLGEFNEFLDRSDARSLSREQGISSINASVDTDIADAISAARRHAATMLLGHTMEEMGMGVMDSGIRQRAGKMLGTASGTPAGELLRSALLFKSFAFSMTGKHWARMMDLPPSMSWKYGATLATVGTVMGALGLQLRNIASGKDPENMASPSFMGSAILKGGGLGFYGDFLYDEATSNDTSLAAGLMGPTASDLEQIYKLTAGYGFAKAKGEFVGDERAKVLRFARSEIPVLNLWYLQAAADHLLWNNMQEAVSPGYLDRMQEKAYNQRGTTYWWNPQETAPGRAPDLKAAIQPERGKEQLQHIAQVTGLQ